MKNFLWTLLLIPILSFGQVNNYGDDSCNVYLLRSSFKNYLTFANRKINTSFCCVAMGVNNLRIVHDPANGVQVTPGGMEVDELYEIEFIDAVCGDEYEAYSSKDVIYLEWAGDQFPYAEFNGSYFNVANQAGADWAAWEWDSLIQFGIPDTNLAHALIAQHMYVYPDSCTGISKGRMDCYHGNPFNLDSVENEAGNTVPLPDGTYWMIGKVNLPPTIIQTVPRMHEVVYLCTIVGNTFQWTSIIPTAPPVPTQPFSQLATKISNGLKATWNQGGSYDHFEVQLYKSNPQGNVGQAVGNAISTTNTTTTITLPTKGAYYVAGIKACNCRGDCSVEVWTNSIKR